MRPQGPHLYSLIRLFYVFLCVVHPGISYNKENDGKDGKYAKTMKLRVLSEEIRVGTEDEARNRRKRQRNYNSEFLLLSRTAWELLIPSRSARTFQNSCYNTSCRGPRGNSYSWRGPRHQ